MLPLTAKGLYRLATKEFNGADPDLNLVAKPGEKPAGLYMWGTYAPGPLAGAISLFMKEVAAAALCRRESLFAPQYARRCALQ